LTAPARVSGPAFSARTWIIDFQDAEFLDKQFCSIYLMPSLPNMLQLVMIILSIELILLLL